MGTINKPIAKAIVAGQYASDNPAKIVTYQNMFDGGLTFAVVFYRENFFKYEDSDACHNVQTVWTFEDGLTKYGEALLAGMDIDS